MLKEYIKLPDNTFVVDTEKGTLFINAINMYDAERIAEGLGYAFFRVHETIEVISH
jgi:hypothetical protein